MGGEVGAGARSAGGGDAVAEGVGLAGGTADAGAVAEGVVPLGATPHAAGIDIVIVIVGFDGMIALDGVGDARGGAEGDVAKGIGTIRAGARAGDGAVPPGVGAVGAGQADLHFGRVVVLGAVIDEGGGGGDDIVGGGVVVDIGVHPRGLALRGGGGEEEGQGDPESLALRGGSGIHFFTSVEDEAGWLMRGRTGSPGGPM